MNAVIRNFAKRLFEIPVIGKFISSLDRCAAIVLIFTAIASNAVAQQPWITGYYSAGNAALPVSKIPWAKYTHIIHFAASTDGNGNVITYYLTQAEINLMTQSNPPGTKVLVAIKDNDNNLNFFSQSTAPSLIGAFVASIVNFVDNNKYDGVDIDWEKNVNAAQFAALLTQLRVAMPNKVITMAGNPRNSSVAGASNAAIDQVNVMCYDLDWGSSYSWYVDPLLQSGNPNVQTCDWDVAYFTNAGVPPSKIGVGMPFYGRRWPHVTQALQTANFSNATTFFYRDLVTDTTRWQSQYQQYDPAYRANYLSINIPNLKEFDSYTGIQFIQDAALWQRNNSFGGFMTYAIEYEYLSSQACDAAFPLSTALYNNANPTSQQPALTTLTAAAGNAKVSLTWSACAGASPSYNVYRNTDADTTFTMIAQNLSTTSYTDTDPSLINGTTYYYYVAAVNMTTGAIGNSNQVSATPTDLSALPLPPTNLTGYSPAKKQIKISWTAPSDATSSTQYEIWRSTVTGGPYKYIDITSNTSYLNMGMASGTTYYYVVRAMNASGTYSVYSNEAAVTSR
jgi:GH18 family chitinase